MSAQTKNKKNINLLVQEGFEHTTAGRILHWLLSAGRTIVVLTELIVIIAFLSRFWLDRTLTDLSDENNAKKNQVEASSQFENDFRSAQQRLKLYKIVEASQIPASEILKTSTALLPADVVLSDFSISSRTKLVLKGESATEAGIAGLLKSLNATKKFKDITLTDITLDTKGTQIIKFAIKAELITNENK